MNKQECFIVMGVIIGVLFLIVVMLSIAFKMGFSNTTTSDVVKDEPTYIEDEKEYKDNKIVVYKEVNYEKSNNSITSDFIINITEDADTLTNELFYQTTYYNYYAKDFFSVYTYIQKDNSSYPLKAALMDKIVSIHDVKDKLKDSVTEELRYKTTFGNNITNTFVFGRNTLTYNNGREIFVSKDNENKYTLLEFLTNEFNITELVSLFKIYNAEGLNDAYVFENDPKSYMFEQNNTRIFMCSNNNVYVGTLNDDYDCK